jgi:hypothetical protein
VIGFAAAFFKKHEAEISETRQNKCKCGRKTFSYENGPKGKRYRFFCAFLGFRYTLNYSEHINSTNLPVLDGKSIPLSKQ